MAGRNTDAKLQLGQPIAGKLADYCAAMNGCPQREVLRAALDLYIDMELAENPGIKKRYEESRRKRQSGGGESVRLISPVNE